MRIEFNGNIEIYIGKLRIELWAQKLQPLSGVSVYIWPAAILRGSAEFIGFILTLNWLVYNVGISIRWLRDGEEV